MNLCLSSLAYNTETEKVVFDTMKKHNIQMVETVFTKIKPWEILSENDILTYKCKLEYYGLKSCSAQSLFYGLQYTLNDIDGVIAHFSRIIEYSKILGIQILVFGSPTMRKLSAKRSLNLLFSKIESMLEGTGIQVIIEPNAKIYGGEYWFSVSEISKFIEDNNFNNIKTMVDYHNSILENFDPSNDLISYGKYIQHIHISEPNLNTIQDLTKHKKFSETIKHQKYSGIITYEVLHSEKIVSSIDDFQLIYK